MDDLDAWRRRFGAEGITFERLGGLIVCRAEAPACRLAFLLQGAQVWSFTPRGGQDLLWRSPCAELAPGRPVRGGIPICWPWLGRHPLHPEFPLHGWTRTAPWRLEEVRIARGGVRARLSLSAEDLPGTPFPSAALTLTLRAGRALDLELDIANLGPEPLIHAGALHTYLAVGQAPRCRVEGLKGLPYHVAEETVCTYRDHETAVVLPGCGELSRTYHHEQGRRDTVLHDPVLGRRLCVRRSGSRSLVLWNPGAERAAALADLTADGWQGFWCVEAANVDHDARVVPHGGGRHRLGTRLECL